MLNNTLFYFERKSDVGKLSWGLYLWIESDSGYADGESAGALSSVDIVGAASRAGVGAAGTA